MPSPSPLENMVSLSPSTTRPRERVVLVTVERIRPTRRYRQLSGDPVVVLGELAFTRYSFTYRHVVH